ncbi:SOS cell division inhibitor [Pantoea sp. RIT-PI-b]|uniref:SOS-induced cell division inhibitor SulA n=1 Tax=unclassified Pantoea TaxID=2630326 RepID=UPI000271342A|nr:MULTISPECIES: SOS-induced cell division inhibitor SulA [unclassified Pantoea]EJL90566.1 SOS-response cell division inhibitor, blocks FtsZ ring formation [Pantoea sp. GM01]KNC15628.1 SOS cell division inhibitor [Pantoea sp. RIT-PI-b]
MRTHFSGPADRSHRYASSSLAKPSLGGITELRSSEQPGMMQLMLLPVLKQLSEQSRWQLWLTPAHKLNRSWMQQSGLPLEKSMHITESERFNTVESMVKALRTGNYSVVLAWIPYELSDEERLELEQAAAEGEALGLILRPQGHQYALSRQPKAAKIPSDLFH